MLCKHFVYTCIYMYVHVAEYAHVHVCDTSPSGYMYMCVWYISRTYMHKYKIMSAGINTRGALHVLCFPYVCVLHLAIHVHEHLNIICHSVFSPESAVGSADESSHLKHNGRKPYMEGFLAFCHISPFLGGPWRHSNSWTVVMNHQLPWQWNYSAAGCVCSGSSLQVTTSGVYTLAYYSTGWYLDPCSLTLTHSFRTSRLSYMTQVCIVRYVTCTCTCTFPSRMVPIYMCI